MKKLLISVLISLFSLEVPAATLYTQMPSLGTQTGTLYQSSWWSPDGHNTDRYVYDSFTLPSARSITELRWRGGYINQSGSVAGFSLRIFGSTPTGQPIVTPPPEGGALAPSPYNVVGSAGQTFLGNFGPSSTPLYYYTLVLPTPFLAAAGALYWVQIEAVQSAVPDWGLAQGTKPVGDGHWEYFKQINVFSTSAGDTAFEVIGPNNPPVATPQSVTVVANLAKAVTVSATDTDGDPLTYRVATQPVHGTLTGTAPNFSYNPALNYTGSDSFTFTANDGFADSNEATVSISVKVNTPPVATSQTVHLSENMTAVLTLSATDIDGDPLTYRVVSLPLNGTLSGSPPNLIYVPGVSYAGLDSFTFVANDGIVDSSVATVDLSVSYAVRLLGNSDFQLLQDAYNTAFDGDEILAQAVPLVENLHFDGIQGVKIRGGYDSVFSKPVVNGVTTVQGTVAIGSGSVIVDRLAIK